MEDDEHDFISFVRGLKPDIVEKMNDCTNIHEAYWEAIHVERMLKRSHLTKVTPQSPQIIEDHVEEPLTEDMQTAKSERDIEDSKTTFGPKFPSMGNDDQNIQAAREDTSIVEIPHNNSHIDFVFGDQQWKLGDEQQLAKDCDLMVQVLHMKCLKI